MPAGSTHILSLTVGVQKLHMPRADTWVSRNSYMGVYDISQCSQEPKDKWVYRNICNIYSIYSGCTETSSIQKRMAGKIYGCPEISADALKYALRCTIL
jgi:hypothetical protein